MNWLIPSNPKEYNSIEAFISLEKVYWKQTVNYEVNDIVYLYISKPIQKVMIKAKVEKINIQFKDKQDDIKFWNDPNKYEQSKNNLFVCLKLININEDNNLTLFELKEYGLSQAPQGPKKITGELLTFITENMNQIHENYYPEEIFYDKNDEFYEGTITKITVNKHERNQEARKECIKYHGVKCKICGFDFEKKYGDIGKDFIHVHHIIPISSKIKLYKIDYKKDLIPVCPNCHAMLHRKNKNGNLYSPDELKLLLDNLNSNV